LDSDEAQQIVAKLIDAVPPGSYLALSHVASDIEPEASVRARKSLNQLVHEKQTHRNHAEIARFFGGLEMVEPGLVPVPQWRPGSEIEAKQPAVMWGGVGRKR
ncbi:MAG TPA: SAM-dependent methyltransferase, partial [Isosphaeraceae bacterium]|nr:SAM-dependent methyltransferase [Isosphaeraceae bacterium]